MMSELISLNQLHRGTNRVFSASVDASAFDYSDGENIEKRLYKILSSTEDLSSCSGQLQQEISDWPTEYHLSPVRANLLRGFDLSGVKRVLELGCGCGAITRYLGELGKEKGFQVDSVEGSPIRAELAALRCRDLDNVTISTANFNALNFPDKYYDLVLFVGVTEYAGRFSNKPTDLEALQDLLALAKGTMTDQGAAVIAIENRTGLKYILGANEDHYALPYIGVNNYPESQGREGGIRTYTQDEWQEQLLQAELPYSEFLYPFPDYKVPTLVLNQHYVSTSSKAQHQLESIRSRDYGTEFDLGYKESLYWQGVSEAGVIPQLANSLMIVAGKQSTTLTKITNFDYSECPDFKFHLPYCRLTRQANGLVSQDVFTNNAGLNHQLTPIHNGASQRSINLYSVWLRSLTNTKSIDAFKQAIHDYYLFLLNESSRPDKASSALTLDYLPSNLSSNTQLHSRQWQHKQGLSVDLLFVRALNEFDLLYIGVIEEKLAAVQQWRRLMAYYLFSFRCAGKSVGVDELESIFKENYELDKQLLHTPIKIDGETRFPSVIERLRLEEIQDEPGSLKMNATPPFTKVFQKVRQLFSCLVR